jgi:hypothetical protein
VDHFQIRFSPRGDRFLCYGQLYDLSTGAMKTLPSRLVAFTPDGDRVIGVQTRVDDRQWSEPICLLPIVRHVFTDDSETRLVVFDASTGEQVFASRWTKGFTPDVMIPDDCSFAVSGGYPEGNRIWELPTVAR